MYSVASVNYPVGWFDSKSVQKKTYQGRSLYEGEGVGLDKALLSTGRSRQWGGWVDETTMEEYSDN